MDVEELGMDVKELGAALAGLPEDAPVFTGDCGACLGHNVAAARFESGALLLMPGNQTTPEKVRNWWFDKEV